MAEGRTRAAAGRLRAEEQVPGRLSARQVAVILLGEDEEGALLSEVPTAGAAWLVEHDRARAKRLQAALTEALMA